MPTKLPHYVLPFFPAIALLTACALQQSRPEPGREGLLKKLPRWLGSGLWLLATVILGIGLPFLVGTDTVMTNPNRAALLLHQEQYRYLLVEAREQRKHAAAVKDLLSGMRHLDRFSGFNYSKGKKITLDLYAKP